MKGIRTLISCLAVLITLIILFLNSDSPKDIAINSHKITAEVADSAREITQGLSDRSELEKDKGMLFIFPNSQIREFWMKDMRFSLDILFIDENKKIVKIEKNLLPCSSMNCERHSSKFPVQYVLEVNSGFVEQNNISVGMQADF